MYITKQANKEISDDSLQVYANKICDEVKSSLYISTYTDAKSSDSEVKNILENRYTMLKGDIKGHIQSLLIWKDNYFYKV